MYAFYVSSRQIGGETKCLKAFEVCLPLLCSYLPVFQLQLQQRLSPLQMSRCLGFLCCLCDLPCMLDSY